MEDMHECEGLTIDDYPCTDVAVVNIGGKYYCEDHAEALANGDEDLFEED